MPDEHVVIVFDSTNSAIHGEQTARRAGFPVRTIPTPRHISSDCGIVLRVTVKDREAVTNLFDERGVRYERVEPL